MCIEAGLDICEVSQLLGYSDIRITQEVYAPTCGRFLEDRRGPEEQELRL